MQPPSEPQTAAVRALSHLELLESRAIYLIREARARLRPLAMLWSVGKDSTVLLWLVRKAFCGHVPFPLVHVDTSYKIPEMIAYRDRLVREWGLELIVAQNRQALAAGMDHTRGRVVCCHALKTEPFKQVVREHGWRGVLLGIRRDEEGTRAKERYFSPRDAEFGWVFREQPPEFWDQFYTDPPPGTHVRVHPLLDWTELDVWEYIERERIPIPELYFARDGRRYRSLGCAPCTGTVASQARTVREIIEELQASRQSERAGRAQDRESEDAFERLRAEGYM
ncbi:MAG: sulfate adenylyltransferase subunit 2 [Planctomycetota bacterium]|nr:MAG: sulfate adenylyltransferase subunit 2 [Planctomycetota bacterium]